ncbi:helix-turn-helix transcriptional regulator [Pseudoflavitalea sp. X16]|uniref:helix-turn-helix domain-containing protein n=1 Tax=Paraflavitalea devenefica TaxID=2716334 RepID=UPI001421BE8E|nr:helix-turn-helix domain-containing protein [Paraflavitalea devenefica]NII25821.1 helix-turn-helix transcriptional regulator [Paraflavitalea devenefica]
MKFKLNETDIERVKQAALMMQESPKLHFTIVQWAAKLRMPEKRLKRAFREVHGKGLYTYLRELRMEKAKQMLLEDIPIKAIIKTIGYKSEGNFSKAFRKTSGESPREWKGRA